MSIQHVGCSEGNMPGRFSVEPPRGGVVTSKLRPLDLGHEKYAWLDLRNLGNGPVLDDLLRAASTLRITGVVLEPRELNSAPETLDVITVLDEIPDLQLLELINRRASVVVIASEIFESTWLEENRKAIKPKVGIYVKIANAASLERATQLTRSTPLLVVELVEETKIPLEIILADAQQHNCDVAVRVGNLQDAEIVFGVLECGARGVIFAAADANELYGVHEMMADIAEPQTCNVQELSIVQTIHVGMGDRACVDMTSYLGTDEGLLLGSFSAGGILACSETHPLPYMPTRPFRVNAGGLQMYVTAPKGRTWYLSDLRSGMEVLAVSTSGKARRVTVGRVKIERRPMMYIEATAPDGTVINAIMQEDWHVRIFGDDGKPRNITQLRKGDRVLGAVMTPGRHVGVKVDELIIEQ